MSVALETYFLTIGLHSLDAGWMLKRYLSGPSFGPTQYLQCALPWPSVHGVLKIQALRPNSLDPGLHADQAERKHEAIGPVCLMVCSAIKCASFLRDTPLPFSQLPSVDVYLPNACA